MLKPAELTQEEFDAWPKCAVPACQNKCCLSLNSIYCWPHTPGSAEEARRNLAETERMGVAGSGGDTGDPRLP